MGTVVVGSPDRCDAALEDEKLSRVPRPSRRKVSSSMRRKSGEGGSRGDESGEAGAGEFGCISFLSASRVQNDQTGEAFDASSDFPAR